MHSFPKVLPCPCLYLDEHLYMDANLNMDCYFILRNVEIFVSVFEGKLKYIKGYVVAKCEGWFAENLSKRGFFTLFQDPASYEDPDLCPTSFDATIDESVLLCCPVQGFPPPQVRWELPNRTLLETGSTILHVTVKTENDFGRYRCFARSLEKNFLTANITIRKRSKYKLKIEVKCASLPLRETWTLEKNHLEI